MTNFQFIKPAIIRANMLENDDMVKTFVTMYLDQCREDFNSLSKAISEQNHEEISSKAHHIKPTMEYIGATAVRIQLQEIEESAKDKQDIGEIQRKFDLLEADFNTLMEELKGFRASLD